MRRLVSANVLRKISGDAPVWLMRFLGNLYLPYFGAGVKIVEVSKDYRYVKVVLKKRWLTTNYLGTQFGGSMYAMVDPFYLMMILNNLGSGYICWDKSAQIEFLKPGRTQLQAEFRIDESLLDTIRNNTAAGEKYLFDLPVEIRDLDSQVICKVTKTIYVRRKRDNRSSMAQP
jgi:acyl-coenzyme A thioesterase PaaI-like protein